MKTTFTFVSAFALLLGSLSLQADTPPPLPDLPVKLGATRVDPGDGVKGLYSISASGLLDNKSEELRLIAYWDGPEPDTNIRNRTTRVATVQSGKSKTLRDIVVIVRDSFARFAAAPAGVKNLELAKIGDIKYGGELRIVAESPEVLRFDYLKPSGPTAIRFGAKEVSEFSKIFANIPPQAVPPR